MPGTALLLPLPYRRRIAALAGLLAMAIGGPIAPAHGQASNGSSTPRVASLVKTPRPCPSPTIAAGYDASCWSVVPDRGSPFYWADGPYAWGQCTYWALELRPDLWNNRSPTDPAGEDWTAHTWPSHALLEGLTVDHVPAAGAVIVWPRSVDDDSGHAAYVQSVGFDAVTGYRLVTLQEMNDTTFDDPARGQGDTMTMLMAAGDLAQVQIIHAPAGATGIRPARPLGAASTRPVVLRAGE